MSDSTVVPIRDCTILDSNLFEAAVPRFKQDDPKAKPVFSIWAGFDRDQLDKVRAQTLAAAGLADAKGLQMPFKDGDSLDEAGERKYGDYAVGKVLFSASTQFALAQNGALIVGPNRSLLAEGQVYPGVIGAVLVKPYTWQYQGKRGISLNLSGVWITAKGVRLEIGGGDVGAAFDAAADSLSFGEVPDVSDPFGTEEVPFS